MSRFSVAKEKVIDDLEAIVEDLFHASRRHLRGGLWNVRNPYRAKSKESQMCVWLRGARRGAWKDFVSDDKGDAIDLVAYGLTGIVSDDSRMTALEWIEARFGLKAMDPATRARVAAEAASRRAAAEAQDQARRKKSVDRARKLFFSCDKDLAGTPVDTYLASRSAALARVPHLGRSIRFHADCEYWRQDDRPRFPAMVSAMVDQEGRIGACHYTWLLPDGSDKAPVEKAKMMFPETSGLVIRVTEGPSGLSAEEAKANGISGPCGITEGIEDALSAAIASGELRMWAAGSLPGLLTVPDHPAVSSWIIFKDNDWGKPQATRQFNRAVARIKGFGKPVEVLPMPADWGKDVNDAIRQGAW